MRVTDVKVERLQDITEKGARTEGVQPLVFYGEEPKYWEKEICTAREKFSQIWNSTVKKFDLDKYGWNVNPFVWVIEFERV